MRCLSEPWAVNTLLHSWCDAARAADSGSLLLDISNRASHPRLHPHAIEDAISSASPVRHRIITSRGDAVRLHKRVCPLIMRRVRLTVLRSAPMSMGVMRCPSLEARIFSTRESRLQHLRDGGLIEVDGDMETLSNQRSTFTRVPMTSRSGCKALRDSAKTLSRN